LAPFKWRSAQLFFARWKQLLAVGLLWTGNVALFIIGIQYTTTIAAQVLYTGVPVYVLLAGRFITSENLRKGQLVGILLGFLGALMIVLKPESIVGFGTPYGNAIIFMATVCWALYLTVSKRVSAGISPLGLTVGSSLIAWIIVGVLMVFQEGGRGIAAIPSLSSAGWQALLFIALGVGVSMMFLYQWGLKYGSAIAAGSMNYLSTVVTAVTGVLILGERVTNVFLIGATLIITGVFLVSTLPLLTRRTQQSN
jgi:drug/metabolite transporter (DMT)-like permease